MNRIRREHGKTCPLESQKLIEKAIAYVELLFSTRKPDWVKYHTVDHAKAVAEAAEEIGVACGLNKEDLEVVILAAWFHDTGYVEKIDGHEERSVKLATSFLDGKGYPQGRIARVAGCIRATRMPQNPRNLMEQVLCDADIAHLAGRDFLESTERVRYEIEHRMERKLTEIEWLTMNTDFAAGHRYHTDCARSKYAQGQAANLKALRERLNQAKEKKGEEGGRR
jgi:predicted metal-dependent HD superfamily phosphohydrolase